jgi:hypothetical protein
MSPKKEPKVAPKPPPTTTSLRAGAAAIDFNVHNVTANAVKSSTGLAAAKREELPALIVPVSPPPAGASPHRAPRRASPSPTRGAAAHGVSALRLPAAHTSGADASRSLSSPTPRTAAAPRTRWLSRIRMPKMKRLRRVLAFLHLASPVAPKATADGGAAYGQSAAPTARSEVLSTPGSAQWQPSVEAASDARYSPPAGGRLYAEPSHPSEAEPAAESPRVFTSFAGGGSLSSPTSAATAKLRGSGTAGQLAQRIAASDRVQTQLFASASPPRSPDY